MKTFYVHTKIKVPDEYMGVYVSQPFSTFLETMGEQGWKMERTKVYDQEPVKNVRIEVRGGVAYCTRKSRNVIVTIKDWDNDRR